MPEGTLAGGGMPGPTLGTQSAAAGRVVCVDAFARVGAKLISTTSIAAAQERRRLRRPGLRLCGIDAELRDGFRDIGGSVFFRKWWGHLRIGWCSVIVRFVHEALTSPR